VYDQPERLQQEVKGVEEEPTAKIVGNTHLSGKADGSGDIETDCRVAESGAGGSGFGARRHDGGVTACEELESWEGK
jgi:hypothetical protein